MTKSLVTHLAIISMTALLIAACSDQTENPRRKQKSNDVEVAADDATSISETSAQTEDGLDKGNGDKNVEGNPGDKIDGTDPNSGDDPNVLSIFVRTSFVNSAPKISWNSLKDATNYESWLSQSQTCGDTAAAKETTADTARKFSGLAPGDYFVCLRATVGSKKITAKNNGFKITVRKGWFKMDATGGPSPRYSPAAAFYNGKAYIYGGMTSKGVAAKDGAIYDDAADKWLPMQSNKEPSGTSNSSFVIVNDKLVRVGGGAVPGYVGKVGYIYDPAKDSWSTYPEDPLLSVDGHHAVAWDGTKIVVVRGYPKRNRIFYDFTPGQADHNIFLNLEIKDGSFLIGSFVSTGDELIIWSGGGPTATYLDGTRLNLKTRTLAPISLENTPGVRYDACAAWTGDRMIVYGGLWNNSHQRGYYSDGGAYDPKNDRWESLDLSTDGPGVRLGAKCVWTGEAFLLFGGRDEKRQFKNDLWKFYP